MPYALRLLFLASKNYTNKVFIPVCIQSILLPMGVPKPMRVAKSRSHKILVMKKSWNGEFFPGLEELAEKEECAITGGQSLWYWAGYAVGWISNLVGNAGHV